MFQITSILFAQIVRVEYEIACVYIYIYIYIYVCMYIYTNIYTYFIYNIIYIFVAFCWTKRTGSQVPYHGAPGNELNVCIVAVFCSSRIISPIHREKSQQPGVSHKKKPRRRWGRPLWSQGLQGDFGVWRKNMVKFTLSPIIMEVERYPKYMSGGCLGFLQWILPLIVTGRWASTLPT